MFCANLASNLEGSALEAGNFLLHPPREILNCMDVCKGSYDKVVHFISRCMDSQLVSCRSDRRGQDVSGEEVEGYITDGALILDEISEFFWGIFD